MADQNPLNPNDPLLDTRQSAEYIGLDNHHTMEVWRSTGRYPELEYVKIGRKVKYRLSTLKRFLEQNTVRAQVEA